MKCHFFLSWQSSLKPDTPETAEDVEVSLRTYMQVQRSNSGPTCSTHMYECTPHVQRPQYIHTFTQQRIEVMVGIDIELDIADIAVFLDFRFQYSSVKRCSTK